MPKIKFAKTDIGTVEGLPNINATAANFNVSKFNGSTIKQLKKIKNKTIVMNILPNFTSHDEEENKLLEEMLITSMNILNEAFSGYESILLLHMMAPGERSIKPSFIGIDNFWTVINSQEFGKNYGLLIKTNPSREKENLLARAVIIINPAGKIRYRELVLDLMDHPNFRDCYNAAAHRFIPPTLNRKFWNDGCYKAILEKEKESKQEAEAFAQQNSSEKSKTKISSPKPPPQPTAIRTLVDDEIMATMRKYSELLEAYNNPFGDVANAENNPLDEDTIPFSPNFKEFTRLFSILGKSQDKIGKMEERFQTLADTLADWLNGTMLSEILEKEEHVKKFSNFLISRLAKNLTSYALTAPTISEEEILKILSSAFKECIEICMKGREEWMKLLVEMLNQPAKKQIILDDIFKNVKLVLIKDSLILDICQDPSLLGLKFSAETEEDLVDPKLDPKRKDRCAL